MCLGGPVQSVCKIKPVKDPFSCPTKNPISEFIDGKMLFLVNPPL